MECGAGQMKFKFRLERDIGLCIHNFFSRLEPISSNVSEHNNKAFLTRINIGGISRFSYFHQMMECGPASLSVIRILSEQGSLMHRINTVQEDLHD